MRLYRIIIILFVLIVSISYTNATNATIDTNGNLIGDTILNSVSYTSSYTYYIDDNGTNIPVNSTTGTITLSNYTLTINSCCGGWTFDTANGLGIQGAGTLTLNGGTYNDTQFKIGTTTATAITNLNLTGASTKLTVATTLLSATNINLSNNASLDINGAGKIAGNIIGAGTLTINTTGDYNTSTNGTILGTSATATLDKLIVAGNTTNLILSNNSYIGNVELNGGTTTNKNGLYNDASGNNTFKMTGNSIFVNDSNGSLFVNNITLAGSSNFTNNGTLTLTSGGAITLTETSKIFGKYTGNQKIIFNNTIYNVSSVTNLELGTAGTSNRLQDLVISNTLANATDFTFTGGNAYITNTTIGDKGTLILSQSAKLDSTNIKIGTSTGSTAKMIINGDTSGTPSAKGTITGTGTLTFLTENNYNTNTDGTKLGEDLSNKIENVIIGDGSNVSSLTLSNTAYITNLIVKENSNLSIGINGLLNGKLDIKNNANAYIEDGKIVGQVVGDGTLYIFNNYNTRTNTGTETILGSSNSKVKNLIVGDNGISNIAFTLSNNAYITNTTIKEGNKLIVSGAAILNGDVLLNNTSILNFDGDNSKIVGNVNGLGTLEITNTQGRQSDNMILGNNTTALGKLVIGNGNNITSKFTLSGNDSYINNVEVKNYGNLVVENTLNVGDYTSNNYLSIGGTNGSSAETTISGSNGDIKGLVAGAGKLIIDTGNIYTTKSGTADDIKLGINGLELQELVVGTTTTNNTQLKLQNTAYTDKTIITGANTISFETGGKLNVVNSLQIGAICGNSTCNGDEKGILNGGSVNGVVTGAGKLVVESNYMANSNVDNYFTQFGRSNADFLNVLEVNSVTLNINNDTLNYVKKTDIKANSILELNGGSILKSDVVTNAATSSVKINGSSAIGGKIYGTGELTINTTSQYNTATNGTIIGNSITDKLTSLHIGNGSGSSSSVLLSNLAFIDTGTIYDGSILVIGNSGLLNGNLVISSVNAKTIINGNGKIDSGIVSGSGSLVIDTSTAYILNANAKLGDVGQSLANLIIGGSVNTNFTLNNEAYIGLIDVQKGNLILDSGAKLSQANSEVKLSTASSFATITTNNTNIGSTIYGDGTLQIDATMNNTNLKLGKSATDQLKNLVISGNNINFTLNNSADLYVSNAIVSGSGSKMLIGTIGGSPISFKSNVDIGNGAKVEIVNGSIYGNVGGSGELIVKQNNYDTLANNTDIKSLAKLDVQASNFTIGNNATINEIVMTGTASSSIETMKITSNLTANKITLSDKRRMEIDTNATLNNAKFFFGAQGSVAQNSELLKLNAGATLNNVSLDYNNKIFVLINDGKGTSSALSLLSGEKTSFKVDAGNGFLFFNKDDMPANSDFTISGNYTNGALVALNYAELKVRIEGGTYTGLGIKKDANNNEMKDASSITITNTATNNYVGIKKSLDGFTNAIATQIAKISDTNQDAESRYLVGALLSSKTDEDLIKNLSTIGNASSIKEAPILQSIVLTSTQQNINKRLAYFRNYKLGGRYADYDFSGATGNDITSYNDYNLVPYSQNNVWYEVFGGVSSQESRDETLGFDANYYGMTIGYDLKPKSWLVFGTSYTLNQINSKDKDDELNKDKIKLLSNSIDLYAMAYWKYMYVSLGTGGSLNFNEQERNISFTDDIFTKTATSSFKTKSYYGRSEVGLNILLYSNNPNQVQDLYIKKDRESSGKKTERIIDPETAKLGNMLLGEVKSYVALSPHGSLQYSNYMFDSYEESGADALNMKVSIADMKIMSATVGGDLIVSNAISKGASFQFVTSVNITQKLYTDDINGGVKFVNSSMNAGCSRDCFEYKLKQKLDRVYDAGVRVGYTKYDTTTLNFGYTYSFNETGYTNHHFSLTALFSF